MAEPISMTLAELSQAEAALVRLGRRALPVKLAYRIARLTSQVSVETKTFHQQHDALVRSMGEERPPTAGEKATGQTAPVVEVTADNLPTFQAQLLELSSVTVNLDTQWGLSVELLESQDITPQDLIALGPLVSA